MEELARHRARFTLEPFERGFGTTLGSSLRRVLLSSLQGCAPTQVHLAQVAHEQAAHDGIAEDVMLLMLNIKGVVFRMSPARTGPGHCACKAKVTSWWSCRLPLYKRRPPAAGGIKRRALSKAAPCAVRFEVRGPSAVSAHRGISGRQLARSKTGIINRMTALLRRVGKGLSRRDPQRPASCSESSLRADLDQGTRTQRYP